MCTLTGHISCQVSITVGGVCSRETSNDICTWAVCNSCLVTKVCHIQNGGVCQKKMSHDIVDS